MDPKEAETIVGKMLDRMMNFDGDPIGNARYVSDHFDLLNEKTRDRWYKLLAAKLNTLPPQACEIIHSLKDRITEKPKNTAREVAIIEKLARFDDDIVGGAQYAKDHFDELSKPTKDKMFNFLVERLDEMPKEAKAIVASLGFKCAAGRMRMISNLEKSAAKLPDGELKRNLIG